LPDDEVYGAVRRFYDRLEGVRKILIDASTTSVRLVVNPERMVIAEAQRTFTYLNLFGYRVDAVIANRLLPEKVSDPYFDRWKVIQAGYLEDIHASFNPIPILTSRLHEQELIGVERLLEVGDEVYGTSDPAEVLFSDSPMTIKRRDDVYVMSLRLPFTSKEEVELSSKSGELFVKVGAYRRTIMLPKALAMRHIAAAQMKDDRLEIIFEQRLGS
jgi:arsenite-transporting ATPase